MDCVATRLAHRGNRHYQVSYDHDMACELPEKLGGLLGCRSGNETMRRSNSGLRSCRIGKDQDDESHRISFSFHPKQKRRDRGLGG
jgi:hypothetical protein